MASRESGATIMVSPGMVEIRTVYGVKQHVPNRFQDEASEDLTGWVHLDGKRVAVQTAWWGDVMVWEPAEEVR